MTAGSHLGERMIPLNRNSAENLLAPIATRQVSSAAAARRQNPILKTVRKRTEQKTAWKMKVSKKMEPMVEYSYS